ncbi:type IX secretion system plug protein [Roseivirga echinicomitans]
MKAKTISIFVLLLFFFQPLMGFQKMKELKYEDAVYEAPIKTVRMYTEGSSVQNNLAPAIAELDQSTKLLLEFDDLRNDADYYFVQFIHCNADWTPSDLRANMYLSSFNEFEIEDFEFSSESKTNYVHYKYRLPKFQSTGNYIAVVYRDRNKEDIVLSKRFRIYKNEVGVGGVISRSSAVGDRLTHQRVEVTLSYGNLNSIDPRQDFKVVVRQNQRPDMQLLLKPTFIDENSKVIRYQNLGSENDFLGGNEFRFFDLSTVSFKGRNIADAGFKDNKPFAQLGFDEVRKDGYFQNLDLNGQFYIRDLEGGGAFAITSEYVNTIFSLKTKKRLTDIYVLGAFNNWKRNDQSKLKWNTQKEVYETDYLLKQGWYDYSYWSADPTAPNEFEKNFFETENLYEIYVYFKPIGGRGDVLVGYSRIDYNRRR